MNAFVRSCIRALCVREFVHRRIFMRERTAGVSLLLNAECLRVNANHICCTHTHARARAHVYAHTPERARTDTVTVFVDCHCRTANGIRNKMVGTESKLKPYFRRTFTLWDYSLSDENNSNALCKSIYREMQVSP